MKIPNIEPEVHAVSEKLIHHGKQAYLVGGAVRDAMLGRKVADYDIATDASPEECLQLFPYAIPTGIQHGTITIVPRSRRF